MKSTRPMVLVTAGLALLALQPLGARAALLEISDMFVVGDSLSDGGNSGLITLEAAGVVFPPDPYAGGRSSNGPTAVEQLWNLYNTDGGLQPSLAGGTNFAVGGATSGTENFNQVNPIVPAGLQPVFAGFGATSQLGGFQAWDAANDFDPATSLFVIWLFPNDVFYAIATGSLDPPTVIANAIANIASIIQVLAAAGAQHFLVPNLANLADAPAFAGDPLVNDLSIAFNTNLAAQLALLDAMLDAEITLFDTDALFQRVLADPGAYGLTNTTDACVNLGVNPPTVCANPDEYLFWDRVHPTARTHEILAQGFRRALIAEPGTLMLLGLGLLVIGVVHRRRRR